MPIFKYTAIDANGRKIQGEVEAKDRSSIVSFLSKESITLISVAQVKAKSIFARQSQVKLTDLVIFSRQLSTLVKTGVPLVRGLGIIAAQLENKSLRDIVNSLQVNIEAGRSLSEALSNYPRVFSPIFIHMVKAGEVGGALDAVLDRVATYLEEANRLANKVKGALTYPAVVIVVAILIVSFLFVAVIPSFQNMFSTLGITLPLPTRILIAISAFIKRGIVWAIVMLVAGFILFKRYLRTSGGRLKFDRALLKLPLFGDLFVKVIIARFARTLSTLIKSGIAILGALDIVAKTANNVVVEQALNSTRSRVSQGEKIGESLRSSGEGVFASLVIDMITVGEETGNISPMLDKIADFYENEVDTTVSTLMSLLEPMVIIFLGIIVGGIAVSLFLPILEILKKLGH